MNEKFRTFGRKVGAWYDRNEDAIRGTVLTIVCLGGAFITGKFIGETIYAIGRGQGMAEGYKDMMKWLNENGYAKAIDDMAIDLGKSVLGIEGPKND